MPKATGSIFHQGVKDMKRWMVLRALKATRGNRKRAAELLGIGEAVLYQMKHRGDVDLDGWMGFDERPWNKPEMKVLKQ